VADVVAQAEAAIAEDVDQLTRLAAERDEYLDTLRRLQADFDNYRKRALKQQTETLERAAETLVMKLLEVLDTVDLARSHGEGEAIAPVASKLAEVLEKEGLERIDPVGKPFDPNEHEAVAHEPGDGDPEVIGLMRAGYRWKGRVLRPALVTVKG
jgi:molecular chaperone GrpE